VADEDPDLAAFRAKLKQGGGMSRGDSETGKRARPMAFALAIGLCGLGAAKGVQRYQAAQHEAETAAAKAKEDAERAAQAEAERAKDAAFDARFASIAAAVKDLDPARLEHAAPSLVAGRKVLGLDAKATSVFERDTQGAGGAFAAAAAEVGIVVSVNFEILMDHPVHYEGGAILVPRKKTFTAIAWPEKKVVAAWTEMWMPPSSMLVRRVGKIELPVDLAHGESRWKATAEQLSAGTAPTSKLE
jgi:hypothetical protein